MTGAADSPSIAPANEAAAASVGRTADPEEEPDSAVAAQVREAASQEEALAY